MTETIAIIDYGSGNLHSAAKAFEHVIAAEGLPMRVVVTGDAADVAAADRLVLPGQGAFGQCMSALRSTKGMIGALERAVFEQKKPFFGICVGMQLLVERGFEYGEHRGLGWLPGDVVPITPKDSSLKIPHMGWNDTLITEAGKANPMLHSVTKKSETAPIHFYFVHSFMVQCKSPQDILAVTDYGGAVTAIIGRDNFLGAQFHPEKSQEDGLLLIKDFLNWTV